MKCAAGSALTYTEVMLSEAVAENFTYKAARWVAAIAASLAITGCANMDTYRKAYPDPNERLGHLLALYRINLKEGDGCHEIRRPPHETLDCTRLIAELDRLVMEFPNHKDLLMANAVLSYKTQRKEVAQLMLDRLLAQPGAHPEAAILRARIALEQGNVIGAVQLLERQAMLAPSNLDLRSALASAYYTQGDYERARNLLMTPGMANHDPPAHSYHLGLIAEAQEDWRAACDHYRRAVGFAPEFAPARARIIGLARYIPCAADR